MSILPTAAMLENEMLLVGGHDALAAFAVPIVILGLAALPVPTRRQYLSMSSGLEAAAVSVIGPLGALTCSLIGLAGTLTSRRCRELNAMATMLLSKTGASLAAALVLLGSRFMSAQNQWLVSAIAAAVYVTVEFVLSASAAAILSGQAANPLVADSMSRFHPILVAHCSCALLAITVYGSMNQWGLLLVVALVFLVRQSYSLLLEIGETYRNTVGVLVSAAEESAGGSRGHAERSSAIARSIAVRCALRQSEVERIGYAALLHDIGSISPQDSSASEVLRDVPFFKEVVSVLRTIDACGHGGPIESENDGIAAFIVALASDIDEKALGEAGHDRQSIASSVSHSISRSGRVRVLAAASELGYGVAVHP